MKRLVIDSNLLLVVAVGSVDAAWVPKFKRTNAYSKTDAATIVRHLARHEVLTTPYVMAEVSNLANAAISSRRDPLYNAISLLTATCVELYTPSGELASHPAYRDLGFTDASLMQAAAERGASIFTADLALCRWSAAFGLGSHQLQHAADDKHLTRSRPGLYAGTGSTSNDGVPRSTGWPLQLARLRNMRNQRLNTLLLLLLLGCVPSVAAQDVDPPRAGPVERVEHLLGEWRVAEMDGEVTPPEMEMRFDFLAGGQLRVAFRGGPATMGTYALVGPGQLSMTIEGDTVEAGAVLDAMSRLQLRVDEDVETTVILTRVGPPPG